MSFVLDHVDGKGADVETQAEIKWVLPRMVDMSDWF